MPWLGICASDLVLALTALASTGVAAFLAPTPPPLASTRGPMSRFRMEPMSRFRVQAVTRTTRRNAPCALTCRAAVKSPTDVALEAWADRVGIQRSVEIGRGSFGRGLFATQDLAAGDAAVRVPLTLALNDQITPLRGREGATMPEPVADLHYTARLAAALAHEMSLGAQSALSHYIAALPEPPRTLHKWEASSLRQLQNNTLEAEADGVYFWRYNNWDAVQDALDAIPGIDRASIDGWLGYGAFMQALDYVCSRTLRVAETAPSNLLSFPKLPLRSFSESAEDASKGQFQKYTALEKGGGGVMRVMVPFLDLANHAPAPTGGYFDLDPEANVCLFATAPVAAGEEVFLDYGARSSDQFLLHYGFLPFPNPAEALFLSLPDGPRHEITWTQLRAPLQQDIRLACAQTLAALPTSLEEDEEALAEAEAKTTCGGENDMSGDLLLALQYRVSKKRLLASAAASPTDGTEPPDS